MNKISLTRVRKFLQKCQFNPRARGPLSIISDVGDADYYEQRAKEFINEAKNIVLNRYKDMPNSQEELIKMYDERIIKAIQLLALARETRFEK